MKKLSLIFWASMVVINASAQFDQWIETLATDKDNIFVGTTTGRVYLLTDSCKTWTEVSNGIGNSRITSLVISGAKMFVGTYEDGVFVSNDKGKLWTPANSGIPKKLDGEKYLPVRSMAAEGTKVVMVDEAGRFFVSNDNAVTWKVGKPSKDAYLRKLALSGENIFAAVGYNDTYEPYLSTDNGMHWKKITNGLKYKFIYSIVASGTNVYAGGIGGMSSYSIENNKWTHVDKMDDETRVLAVNGSSVLASTNLNLLHGSSDDGKTWKYIGSRDLSGDNKLLGINGTTIYTVISGVLYYSMNKGESWVSSTKNSITAVAKAAPYVSSGTTFHEVGTQNGVTLYAEEYAGVIFKVVNSTGSDINVHIKLLFECKSTSFIGGESFQKFETIWRISVPTNSTRSYDDDPAACSVDGCKDHTVSWKIVSWNVTAN